jgi:hypothetical protein
VCLSLLFVPGSSTRADELATLTGFLTDPKGFRVPAAKVQVTNIETNVSYSSETNDEGLYRVPGIPAGTYRIIIQKTGFKTVVKQGVELHVQDVIAVNFQLELGSMAESVTVEEGASMINTTNGTISTVVDPTYVKNMPLNGRSFQDLISLTPGIVTNSPQQPGKLGQSGEFSVNGQRTEANYYTVDGVSANVGTSTGLSFIQYAGISGSVPAATALGTTQALISIDALQEFRVQSSTYSAEYGRNPGGQFAFETKSGTNQWHGTAYDYLRNGYFDAQDWFSNYFRLPEPAIRQNDFGGTFGGPVKIPALYNGKDKTFFLVSYEGLRLSQPQPASISYVPDLCMRGMASCPSGRQPAPGALLPVLNAYPLPSLNGLVDTANGVDQYVGTWSNPSSLDATSVRFDQIVNGKLRVFFRFSNTGSSSVTRGTSQTTAVSPTLKVMSASTLRTYTAGASSALSSRLSNEFRVNYSSNQATYGSAFDTLGGGIPVNLQQLVGLGSGVQVYVLNAFSRYEFDLMQFNQSGAQKQWNFVDTLGLSLGRHQFKFGADYRRLTPSAVPPAGTANYLFFSQNAVVTNSPFLTSSSLAPAYPLYKNFSAFAQDEWRLSQRLSISMGLRWEVNPPPGVTQGLRPSTVQGSNPSTWTLAPQGTSLWQTTWYNFAPRLGFAYILRNKPGRETVVRGGGGVFFDTAQQAGSVFSGAGFFVSGGFHPGTFPGTVVLPPIHNPPVPPYITIIGFASHLQLPYTLQWNASIEQALGKSQALTISHVGSHAARLLQQEVFNSSNYPVASTIILFENGLTSDYDSLQIQFRRRLSRGMTALASYTWSHCLDYGSSNLNFGYQRGNCDFDVRHNVSAAFSYDLPNVAQNGYANVLLHHWGLDNRFTARTAFPVGLNGSQLLQPNGQFYYAGLNIVPGQPIYLYGDNCASVLQGLGNLKPGQGCPGGRAINPQAFANVTSGLGNAPRNFVRGFGIWQVNTAVRREFPVRENLKLQFRAEAFNIFNHPNFGSINPNFGQQTFGQARATLTNSLGVLNPLYQMGGPRSMQFALKFIF